MSCHSSTTYEKHPFSMELPLLLHQRWICYISIGLFLGSLFFHSSLFFHHYHTVLITIALKSALKLESVSPPTFFFLSIVLSILSLVPFCLWSFWYKLYNHHKLTWWDFDWYSFKSRDQVGKKNWHLNMLHLLSKNIAVGLIRSPIYTCKYDLIWK